MENLTLIVALLALLVFTGMTVAAFAVLLRLMRQPKAAEDKPEAPPLTPQEREALRQMQEAQKKYDDGFADMMRYDGRPHRKDSDGI